MHPGGWGYLAPHEHPDFGVPPGWPWGEPSASKRGRGPPDYRRSDHRIAEDINDRLRAQQAIDASDVHVAANDGHVELTGTVESRQDKRAVEAVADSVAGTTDVDNRLVIRNVGNTVNLAHRPRVSKTEP
jgi:hypothetical protein